MKLIPTLVNPDNWMKLIPTLVNPDKWFTCSIKTAINIALSISKGLKMVYLLHSSLRLKQISVSIIIDYIKF